MNVALNQPWAERLAWTLLHFLWQGALLAGLYASARATLARRLDARARYGMACTALLAMTLAPAGTYLWMARTAAPPLGAAAASSAVAPVSSVSAASTPDAWQQALPWIVMAWFAGVVAFSVRLAGACVSTAMLRASQTRPAPPEWQRTLERLIERMHIRRPVRLLVSARIDSPSVAGWLKPVILAPLSVLSGLPSEHVEALLAHELAHVRRHDYLVNVLQGIAESLLFYHPAVWWVSNQIRTEREHCCDDLAVAVSGDVLIYARALAGLESARPAHFKTALAANDGSLLRRIRRLVDPASSHGQSGSGAAWLLSLLMLVAIGGVAMRGAQDPVQPLTVQHEEVWSDTVKQGDMTVEVRGLGMMTSKDTAELRIAETQLKEVVAGKPATLDFPPLRTTVSGVVTAIQPGVSNGTVGVEVRLSGALPQGAGPQSKVDGIIVIRKLSNVVYVGRPVFGLPNSQGTIFKIELDGKSAVPVKVQFGASSVNVIEVKSGLQPGDKVILSDMSGYEKAQRVALK
jgi:beta-lactamase regulating signal transducer with metallopeptidase domain